MIVPFIEKSTNNDLKKINKLELQNLLTNDKPLVNSNLELKLDNDTNVVSTEINSDNDDTVTNFSKAISNIIIKEDAIDIPLEDNKFLPEDNSKIIPVDKAVTTIIKTLDIKDSDLKPIIQEVRPFVENKVINIKKEPQLINKLFNNNKRINQIQKYYRDDTDISEKISKLKNKLSILQFNSIIEKDASLLNDVIKTIDNKVININNILENNIIQKGGQDSYYYKYLKYKIKYLELVNTV